MRIVHAAVFGAFGFMMIGCEVEAPRPVHVRGPAVEVAYDEPAPEERTYVYEPGYPPGTFLYGGFYYYDGRRYGHDDFERRIVHDNIAHHRYMNIDENRRAGREVEANHRAEFGRRREGGR